MDNYKIKITCTSKEELCFNGNNISKKSHNKYQLGSLINNCEYIYKALILHKKSNKTNFTTKTLEFLCDRELSELDFEGFIQSMLLIGFSATRGIAYFIQNNEPIYIYKIQKKIITKITKPIHRKKSLNNSTYSTQTLYKAANKNHPE